MGNELVKRESETMPIEDLRRNVNLIQRVLREVMQKGTHYDVVPGCGNKETLLKAGAEKILATFRIGVNHEVEDLGDQNERRYRVTAKGFYIPTGNPIGSGVGECSSNEKKFAWREAVCLEEFESVDDSKKQILFKKGYKEGQIQKVMQIKTVPADIANTVLKMAKKRAMIDLCLSATACSDIFTQDMEPDEVAESPAENKEQKSEQKPQENKTQNPISEAQAKRLFAIMSSATSKHNQEDLKNYLWEKYGVTTSREIDKANYNHIIDWIEGKVNE